MRYSSELCKIGSFLLAALSLLCIESQATATDPRAGGGKVQSGSLAVTIGPPAVLNWTICSIGDGKWGWLASGGYYPAREGVHATGIQFGFLRVLGRSRHHYSAISVHGGYMEWVIPFDNGQDGVWAHYAGGGIVYKWRFLYSQIELNMGQWEDVWSNPQIFFQLGIVLKTFATKAR